MDSARLAAVFKNTFDVIMVDAPCSGEGMFRKEQAAIDEWSIENVNKCACRQAEILENAAKCLASGGYIIYATCTFSLEENEMTVDNFLKLHSEFEIIPVKSEVQKATADGIKFNGCACENIHFARRFYPHKAKGEGQFMAVLHHKGDGDFIPNKAGAKPVKLDPAVIAFLDDTLENYNKDSIAFYGDNPVFYSGDIDIKKGTALCAVSQ